jgi:alcohol dehydrogenase class IV
MPAFEFATATRVVFGAGSVGRVGELTDGFGRRALVVTGRSIERARRVVEALAARGVSISTFAVPHEPDIAAIERGVRDARANACEFVVGIGGGSVLDAAKAIAAMVPHAGELLDYVEVVGKGTPLSLPSLPCAAIPTTAGTGSEVTRNAVLASREHGVKVSLRGPQLFPRLALVDPELTRDLPADLTAHTGLDALTQLIEPYVSARANPMTDALCAEGIRLAAPALRRAVFDGRNPEAREEMALASVLSGMALTNAGLGAVHGFAAVIGGMFHAPHGAICAALLPHVMAGNLRALQARPADGPALRRFEETGRLLTGAATATSEDGIEWLETVVRDLEIPSLRTYGLTDADVAAVVEKAARASSMKANPVELTSAELRGMLTAAL